MTKRFINARRVAGLMAAVLSFEPIATALADTNNGTFGAARPSSTGINYNRVFVEEVPWTIHVVRMDRSRSDLRLETTLGGNTHIGMGLISDQVKSVPTNSTRVLAAVNGDFYKNNSKYPGDPEGLQVSGGELISGPSDKRSCFWIDAVGAPHHGMVQSQFRATLPDGRNAPFGLNEERKNDAVVLYSRANGSSTRTSGGTELILKGDGTNAWLPLRVGATYTAIVTQVQSGGNAPLTKDSLVLSVGPKIAEQVAAVKPGDKITLSLGTNPSVAGCKVAIGGGPGLVRGKKAVSFNGIQPRHPRVALGWNKDYFYLVEVDGRQKTSAGMTFPEIAKYMQSLGCDEAINLDGGGSATMWVFGHVMNNPSEGRERPAANALLVVRDVASGGN
jgi:hypothetical protein